MLPPFIIDQIRRREDEERRRRTTEQPRLELPIDDAVPPGWPAPDAAEEDEPHRGVIIIDLG
jgi:hypothetical protein